MNKREYYKYNFEVIDYNDNPLKIGDTVVINNHCGASPIIGKIKHITQSGRLAIECSSDYWTGDGKRHISNYMQYRLPCCVVKINDLKSL